MAGQMPFPEFPPSLKLGTPTDTLDVRLEAFLSGIDVGDFGSETDVSSPLSSPPISEQPGLENLLETVPTFTLPPSVANFVRSKQQEVQQHDLNREQQELEAQHKLLQQLQMQIQIQIQQQLRLQRELDLQQQLRLQQQLFLQQQMKRQKLTPKDTFTDFQNISQNWKIKLKDEAAESLEKKNYTVELYESDSDGEGNNEEGPIFTQPQYNVFVLPVTPPDAQPCSVSSSSASSTNTSNQININNNSNSNSNSNGPLPQSKKRKKSQTGQFICPYPGCNDGFERKFTLNRHLKIHTGELPYQCEECGKKFREKSSHKRHLQAHNGSKPYSCDFPECGKRFADNANKRRHMKARHDDKSPGRDQSDSDLDSGKSK